MIIGRPVTGLASERPAPTGAAGRSKGVEGVATAALGVLRLIGIVVDGRPINVLIRCWLSLIYALHQVDIRVNGFAVLTRTPECTENSNGVL